MLFRSSCNSTTTCDCEYVLYWHKEWLICITLWIWDIRINRPYREQHPNTLSGGQKQRVAVAVSMICGKDLLVFDEPTSGLDFDSMTQVAGLIRRLSDMGKVIFIVTHDFEFVCRTCSRVLHFDEGEMPDDVSVTMEALPKLRELFSVSDGKER